MLSPCSVQSAVGASRGVLLHLLVLSWDHLTSSPTIRLTEVKICFVWGPFVQMKSYADMSAEVQTHRVLLMRVGPQPHALYPPYD